MTITDQAGLNAALDKCSGGEEIDASGVVLTGAGIYGRHFPADNPVKIKLRTQPQGGTNGAGSPDGQKIWPGLEIANSSGIKLVEADCRGLILSEYQRFGRALMIHDSDDITVERSRVGDTWQGVWAYLCNRLAIVDSDIQEVGPFGIQVATINGFTVRRVEISGFHIYLDPTLSPSISEHSDMIMIEATPGWGPGSEWAYAGTEDVVIEDCFGLGDPDNKPQGIFFDDTSGPDKGPDEMFRRITIRNNDLWGTMWGAITGESFDKALDIVDNRVRALAEAGRPVPGGEVTQALIHLTGGSRPRTLSGNSGSVYAEDDAWLDTPGFTRVGRVPFADAQAALKTWRSARAAGGLPSNGGVTPAPMPQPNPTPAPTPVPAPTPAPAPQPKPTPVPTPSKLDALKAEAAALQASIDHDDPIRDDLSHKIAVARSRLNTVKRQIAKLAPTH